MSEENPPLPKEDQHLAWAEYHQTRALLAGLQALAQEIGFPRRKVSPETHQLFGEAEKELEKMSLRIHKACRTPTSKEGLRPYRNNSSRGAPRRG